MLISPLNRLRRRLASDDDGITLVELLVAIMLFAIVLTMVASIYGTMSKTVNFARATSNNYKLSSLGMAQLSDSLRFAITNPVQNQPADSPAFTLAKAESITLYTYIDTNPTSPKPVQVNYSLDASRRLIETRYAAYSIATGYWAYQTTPYSTRTLTGQVLAPTGTEAPLFTYLDKNNAPLVIADATVGLTSVQIPQVAAVLVTMKIKGDANSGEKPLFFTNTVGLPNLGLNRTGQN